MRTQSDIRASVSVRGYCGLRRFRNPAQESPCARLSLAHFRLLMVASFSGSPPPPPLSPGGLRAHPHTFLFQPSMAGCPDHTDDPISPPSRISKIRAQSHCLNRWHGLYFSTAACKPRKTGLGDPFPVTTHYGTSRSRHRRIIVLCRSCMSLFGCSTDSIIAKFRYSLRLALCTYFPSYLQMEAAVGISEWGRWRINLCTKAVGLIPLPGLPMALTTLLCTYREINDILGTGTLPERLMYGFESESLSSGLGQGVVRIYLSPREYHKEYVVYLRQAHGVT